MSEILSATARSNSTARSVNQVSHSKETYRRQAGIASTFEFPYTSSQAWAAAAPIIPPLYSYNPIIHTVDKYVVDGNTGKMVQYKTNRVTPDLEPSAKDGVRVNRRKGVIEYADLTRNTSERWNSDYHKTLIKNPKAFVHNTSPFSRLCDVAVRNHENPFRVGR